MSKQETNFQSYEEALAFLYKAIGLYLEADEDLKDLRESKEESKNEEGVSLNKWLKI